MVEANRWSPLARTIARRYHEQERLGASFSFSRGGGDVSHAGELANISDTVTSCICEAIEKQRYIASKSPGD
jgi:hypothetical protein